MPRLTRDKRTQRVSVEDPLCAKGRESVDQHPHPVRSRGERGLVEQATRAPGDKAGIHINTGYDGPLGEAPHPARGDSRLLGRAALGIMDVKGLRQKKRPCEGGEDKTLLPRGGRRQPGVGPQVTVAEKPGSQGKPAVQTDGRAKNLRPESRR